jgi:DMSO/TMAO reductase YedYZ molybdopterin-dependent catalytic subunit
MKNGEQRLGYKNQQTMKFETTEAQTHSNRRHFIKTAIHFAAWIGLLCAPLFISFRNAYAKTKRLILPRGTKMSSLVNQNPASLDTRNLEITPLNNFETMGLNDHMVDLNTWRFEVSGKVKKPLNLTYPQLIALPAIERNVLLICPGFFSNYGRWKGISVTELLKLSEAPNDITHITFRGPNSRYEKVERFPIADIVADKVFLAYQLNGKDLPQKHGFPLRAVAEDYYGSTWVKYVYKMEAHKIESRQEG